MVFGYTDAGSPIVPKELDIIAFADKITDINESDTNIHSLDLAIALNESREIVSIVISANRVSGTGSFLVFPNGNTSIQLNVAFSSVYAKEVILEKGTNVLKYAQSVANDDFDIFCLGYIIRK